MIVTWRIGVRIGLIVLAAVLLQTSFFSFVELFGVSPDLLAVVVVSLGLLGGGVVGAVCGFAAGILLDSFLLQTLGISSLALLLVGYLAGRVREGVEISNSLIPPLLIAGFTVVAGAALAAMQLMLGVDSAVSALVVREILVKGLLAFLLAVPTYPLIRRALRPALIDEASGARVLSEGRAGARDRGRSRRRGPRIRRRVAAP